LSECERLLKGREELFNYILEERDLEWKPEEFLGWHHHIYLQTKLQVLRLEIKQI
jgi:hypothetical protein